MITLAEPKKAPTPQACPECGHTEARIDGAHFDQPGWAVVIDGQPVWESARRSLTACLIAFAMAWQWPAGEINDRWDELRKRNRAVMVPVRLHR
jgi:hypothetical protein